MLKFFAALTVLMSIGAIGYGLSQIAGDGALKRLVTFSGVYSVCKPDGYNAVCFLDADGKEGGMFCMKLEDVSPTGACLK